MSVLGPLAGRYMDGPQELPQGAVWLQGCDEIRSPPVLRTGYSPSNTESGQCPDKAKVAHTVRILGLGAYVTPLSSFWSFATGFEHRRHLHVK